MRNHRPEQTIHKKHGIQRLVSRFSCYFLLVGISFVYLYPILYMIIISLMPTSDLVNPTIRWIPTHLELDNFKMVYKVLDYGKSFWISVGLAGTAAALQTMTSALAGYALARWRVPFKKLWLVMLIVVFIIPTDVVMVPKYVLFNTYHLTDTIWSILLPAALGQGLKSSLFILIFYQVFRTYPKSFDEAAQLDGAGRLRAFFRIALPMAVPSIVLAILFSFVWYWNETTQLSMFAGTAIKTLPRQLQLFDETFGRMFEASYGSAANRLNERIQMAATILVVAPLMALYLVMQKKFVQGIEASGITGE